MAGFFVARRVRSDPSAWRGWNPGVSNGCDAIGIPGDARLRPVPRLSAAGAPETRSVSDPAPVASYATEIRHFMASGVQQDAIQSAL